MDNTKDNILHKVDRNLSADNLIINWYKEANEKMKKANNISSYLYCKYIFEMLNHLKPNYKDCETKIKQCNNKIINIKAKNEKQKIKIKEEKEKQEVDRIKKEEEKQKQIIKAKKYEKIDLIKSTIFKILKILLMASPILIFLIIFIRIATM